MTDLRPDPRVYFAGERTLLAWVRTGITLIALGFVVARFSLIVRVLELTPPDSHPSGVGPAMGTVLALFGGFFTLLASYKFVLFVRSLGPDERPRVRFEPALTLALAFVVSATGIALALYLIS
ncbi:MAG TPA: DUF202 domain-containing protein [Polyangiaceae bacterium]|nr:DUF202 domain-containing protein [Polyangiaceae bacterium]